MAHRWCSFFSCVVASLLLAGCGSGGTQLEGTVTFDGQPVDGGTITFMSEGGQGTNAGGPIQGGKYAIESKLPPGKFKVEINWFKSTGKTLANKSDPGTKMDETKQVIPMEYNKQSKLTAEVKSGSNTFNFELKSGGAVDTRPPGSAPPRTKAAGDS